MSALRAPTKLEVHDALQALAAYNVAHTPPEWLTAYAVLNSVRESAKREKTARLVLLIPFLIGLVAFNGFGGALIPNPLVRLILFVCGLMALQLSLMPILLKAPPAARYIARPPGLTDEQVSYISETLTYIDRDKRAQDLSSTP